MNRLEPSIRPVASSQPSMWRYADRLPLPPGVRPVSLGEGLTPLVASRLFEGIDLFWKDETRNPTGSHKDRALSVAATDAVSRGARTMVVVSAGSTGISNAAYAAAAGLKSIAVVSKGAPVERLFPIHALGSRLIAVDADIDMLIAGIETLNGRNGLYVASTTQSSNPVQAEAARTIAYELATDLGDAPDVLVVPVGGGGTLGAIHRGFRELLDLREITRLPRLIAVVPSGYANLRTAFEAGIADRDAFQALPAPRGGPTCLNKLAHDHPPDGIEALRALRESDGLALDFDDEPAIRGVRTIAATDGLYFEPSTAILLPALRQLAKDKIIGPGMTVVALGCGSGFRETSVLVEAAPLEATECRVEDLAAVLESS